MKTKHLIPNPGDKFGQLTVLSYYYIKEDKRWAVDLQCDCGNILKKKRLGHLYGSESKNPLLSCKDCGYIRRGKNMRDISNGQAKLAVWFNYQTSAKKRNISWDISKDTFFNMIELPCFYCGISKTSYLNNPKTSPWAQPFFYTGIDRVNSSLGYSLTNIVPCCKVCNRSKMDMSIEDFKGWIQRVYEKFLSE